MLSLTSYMVFRQSIQLFSVTVNGYVPQRKPSDAPKCVCMSGPLSIELYGDMYPEKPRR